ncbi:MAG: hypothetical protein WCS94_00105 [Verrucomicrobiota bacterium]
MKQAGPKRIPTDGEPALAQTPFAALSSDGLPAAPEISPVVSTPTIKLAKKHRGRVDILRVTLMPLTICPASVIWWGKWLPLAKNEAWAFSYTFTGQFQYRVLMSTKRICPSSMNGLLNMDR